MSSVVASSPPESISSSVPRGSSEDLSGVGNTSAKRTTAGVGRAGAGEGRVERGPASKKGDGGVVRVADASFLAGAVSVEQLPPPALPEVAFAGRSNVGKSSLLNALMDRKSLARTSSTPGCTRQINQFGVRLVSGEEIRFIDLPGYGYAKVSKKERADWGPMIEGYLTSRPTLRAVAILVDLRRGFEEEELQLLEFLRSSPTVERNKPVTILGVATKADKLPLSRRKAAVTSLSRQSRIPVVGFSAETKEGREELWGHLIRAL